MTEPRSSELLRRLLHRWLIEYNPLYLLSAALVLGGVTLLSRALVHAGSLHGQLGVTAIAEVYAWALIAGAALLTRIELRRPAVMLALLAVLYQGDLTLHTETSVYLGLAGALASLAWLASFVLKLLALGWAVKLRPSRSALLLPTLGALGLALIPRVLAQGSREAGTLIVGAFVFGLFAFALHTERPVRALTELDAWGRTVLRRAVRATWVIWAGLLAFHVLFWCSEYGVSAGVLVPVGLLLATRFVERELALWCVVAGALASIAHTVPEHFSGSALMAAAMLALRALRKPVRPEQGAAPPLHQPYRAAAPAPPHEPPRPGIVFVPATGGELRRLFTGTLFASYLSVWTLGWSGGAWPAHVLALDLVLVGLVVLAVVEAKARIALLPLGVTGAHFLLQTRLVTAPASTLQWGLAAVISGFALLFASLGGAWWFRRRAPGRIPTSAGPVVGTWGPG